MVAANLEHIFSTTTHPFSFRAIKRAVRELPYMIIQDDLLLDLIRYLNVGKPDRDDGFGIVDRNKLQFLQK